MTPARRARPLEAVDEVEILGPGRLRSRTRIHSASGYLAAHYPGRPIYPGVFVLESALQALERAWPEACPRLVAVRSMRLLAPVEAPALLTLDLGLDPSGPDAQEVTVRATVDDRAVANLALAVACMGLSTPGTGLPVEGAGDVSDADRAG